MAGSSRSIPITSLLSATAWVIFLSFLSRLFQIFPTWRISIFSRIRSSALDTITERLVQEAIAHENVSKIQSVKGIGLKTAQRVIVDLRDKILKSYEISEEMQTPNNTIRNEALSALEVLGFNKKKVEKTIQVILQEEPEMSLEDLIKKALKNL